MILLIGSLRIHIERLPLSPGQVEREWRWLKLQRELETQRQTLRLRDAAIMGRY